MNSTEYIEKNFALEKAENKDYLGLFYHDEADIIIKFIESLPTVEASPIRHGVWLPCDKKGYILTETALRDGGQWYGNKCSECRDICRGNAFTKYCPTCGAKMDAERKEE